MNDELLALAQQEYSRQLQEYLTSPIKKPDLSISELIDKFLKECSDNNLKGDTKNE
jgi:hypothetical protein